MSDSEPLWVFGYGSLVWRPSFEHQERRAAWIGGWARRFWQGSTDHRGVPGAPGRVVTLVPAPGARCFGTAYRIAAGDREEVLEHLDWREKGGYARHREALHLGGKRPSAAEALVYVAGEDNPNYLGPAPLRAIAEQVHASHGPSGSNLEYVLKLAEALRQMGAHDSHVFGLERVLRSRVGKTSGEGVGI